MPELPEVETIRRDLHARVIGKRIVGAEARDRKVAKGDLAKILIGQKFVKIERRGKLLAFLLPNEKCLLVHLKMTGQLIYKQHHELVAGGHKISESDLRVPNNFTRVIFNFSDKSQLFFNDLRRFGYLKIVDRAEKERIWRDDFGIEPLTDDFQLDKFAALFAKRKTNLKALLLNQKLIAGIGNIYADEACWCARVAPWKKVSGMTTAQIKKLFQCITHVLQVALKNRGTSFSDFVDASGGQGEHYDFLNVYERDGQKCRRCGTVIKKTRHAGRGTHYCPRCQE